MVVPLGILGRWLAASCLGRVLALGLGFGVCQGCFVVTPFSFEEEENAPPSIESAPAATALGTTLQQIVRMDLRDDPDLPDAESEKRFPVIVRDPNLEQQLSWRVFLNFRQGEPGNALLLAGGALPASGSASRDLEFTVSAADIGAPGCHKVELLVSSAFEDEVPQRRARTTGDLGTAVWWIYATDAFVTSVDFQTCP